VDGSIDTAHIADNAVTGDKIADNATLAGNVTVSGNFTVSGDTTTVNTSTLAVEDPLVSLATGNNSADAVDIGMYGLYDTSGSQDLYGGLFRDASDSGKWKLFKDNQAAPTTTVNTSGTGYAVGTLVANLEGSVTAANSIDSDQYVDGSIDTAQYAARSIDATALGTNSVNTAHIAASQVTVAKMAANSVDSDQYVDGSIDSAHIADDAVTGGKIADDALDSNHYADGSIDLAHLSSSLGDLSSKGVTYVGNNETQIRFNGTTDQRFTVNSGEEMRLEADGDLHVDGDVIAYSTTISDETLKYNINPVEFALDKIQQLKGVTFNYFKDNKESAGLLAQDVEKVMPSAVTEKKIPLHTDDDKAYKTLHYDSVTAILVEAIKELTAKVKKLEER
jgi:hypothetical protein